MTRFRWKTTPSQGWDGSRYIRVLDRSVGDLLNAWAPQIESAAKTGAPWTDRTGNARQSLAAYAVKVARDRPVQAVAVGRGERQVGTTYNPGVGGWALILRHGMSYGRALELNRQGRYAIVEPTLQQYQARVWDGVKGLVK